MPATEWSAHKRGNIQAASLPGMCGYTYPAPPLPRSYIAAAALLCATPAAPAAALVAAAGLDTATLGDEMVSPLIGAWVIALSVSSSRFSVSSISSYSITSGGSMRTVVALVNVPEINTPRLNSPEAT